MQLITQIDLLSYSLIITLLLIIYIVKNYNVSERSTNLYLKILVSTTLVICTEALSWIFDGIDTRFGISMNIFFNSLLIILETIPGLFWIFYFDYKILGSNGFSKRRSFYIIPGILVTLITLLSLKTGVLFTITPGNIYTRGIGVYICGFIFLIQYFIAFRLALLSRKNSDSDIIVTITAFFVLPIIGMFLQLVFYGVTLIWPLFSLVNLIAFIMLEKDVMLRDPLTGVYTRGVFEQKIIKYLGKGISFSLIMIDLDKFKVINDTFGHNEGDKALLEVVDIVNNEIRRSDLLCRYGGDEFLILLKSEAINTGLDFIRRITSQLNNRNSNLKKLYKIDMSIGHVFINESSNMGINEILEEVDKRMYMEKLNK